MENYLFVFDVPCEDTLKLWQDANDDDYHTYWAKEKLREIDYAKSIDSCIYWNEWKHEFTDINFKPIKEFDKSRIYFPRVTVGDFNNILDDLHKYGLTPIVEKYERYAIERWFDLIPYHHLNRLIYCFNVNSDLFVNVESISQNKVFIKSLNRDDDFHRVVETSDYAIVKELTDKIIKCFKSTDDMVVSEWINMDKEYRVWYINGKTYSIMQYKGELGISVEVAKYAETIRQELVGKALPNNVVVDIYQSNDGEFGIVECNCVTCAEYELEF
jgi:hypothetical protein